VGTRTASCKGGGGGGRYLHAQKRSDQTPSLFGEKEKERRVVVAFLKVCGWTEGRITGERKKNERHRKIRKKGDEQTPRNLFAGRGEKDSFIE